MSAQNETDINLLPQKGLESSTKGRFLLWVLSTFRVIVIVTELLVMVAFLSRFWLDVQNTDLDEEINQKKSVLEASLEFENDFKDTQKRIQAFSQLTEDQDLPTNTMDAIASLLPQEVLLESVNFNFNQTTIAGLSLNERDIQQLIVNLESSDLFSEVRLSKIEQAIENPGVLNFTLAASHQ